MVGALIGVLVAWFSQRDAGKSQPEVAMVEAAAPAQRPRAPVTPPFDFYLMALTVHPAFCADGHTRKRECQVRSHRPLVIHGLWPERNEPRTYPRDCPAAPLVLDSA